MADAIIENLWYPAAGVRLAENEVTETTTGEYRPAAVKFLPGSLGTTRSIYVVREIVPGSPPPATIAVSVATGVPNRLYYWRSYNPAGPAQGFSGLLTVRTNRSGRGTLTVPVQGYDVVTQLRSWPEESAQ